MKSYMNLPFGHEVEFHNGATLRFDSSFSGPGFDKVSLRQGKGEFEQLRHCREGFTPHSDSDPLEIVRANPKDPRFGTRELISPDGKVDIEYGYFHSLPWGGHDWICKLSFPASEPGRLPEGLSASPDGAWLNLPKNVGWIQQIPYPLAVSTFALKEPVGPDMAEMVWNLRR
jgi:hypothetical protein